MEPELEREQQMERADVRREEEFLSEVYDGVEGHPYRKLLLFAGQVWAACRMNAWCFSPLTGNVLNSFSAHEKDLASFFVIGKCLDYVLSHKSHRHPFLLSDSLGMVWIAEYLPPIEGQEPELLFVFGPVFTSVTSPLVIADNLDRMHFSFTVRKQLEDVLNEVPILMNSTIEQYARMLHFTLTGEPCDSKRFLLQKAKVEVDLFSESKEASYEELNGHRISLERAMAQEESLLNMIREGKRDEKLLSSLRKSNVSDFTGGNPMRNAKDELLILCTKYMLAAEQAGLPPRVSRTMQLRYIRVIEKCRSVTELTDVERSMTEEFIARVAELKAAPEKSREIVIAEDYIRANLTRPLSIEDVARAVGYSDYYLSRKFAKETGLKFADYVNRERVRYAQTLLRTSSLPVQAISDMLQFTSLSYFGRVFKKITGQSPKEYREGK